MRILGFLQNAVFYEGISKKDSDRYMFDSRDRMFHFWYNSTGKKIRNNIGLHLFLRLVLDNVASSYATDYKPVKADSKHVGRVIGCVRPHIIICFGMPAKKAVIEALLGTVPPTYPLNDAMIWHNGICILFTNHPMARNPKESIIKFAVRFKKIVDIVAVKHGAPEKYDYVNYRMVK